MIIAQNGRFAYRKMRKKQRKATAFACGVRHLQRSGGKERKMSERLSAAWKVILKDLEEEKKQED